MTVLYRNLNIVNIRSYGRDNTKEQYSCISIVVPLKTEWLDKKENKNENNMKDIIGIFIAY